MPDSHADSDLKRRTVLQGAGAVALAGYTVSTGAVAQDDDADDQNMLVLIYDDSPREDYTKAFPVHEEFGVPGCAAVCPGLMGTHGRWMDPGHLEEMHAAGWEVMSHTLEHRALGEIPVRSDIEIGDTDIHVQSSLHGRFEGDPLIVFDQDTEARVTAAGRADSDDEAILELEQPITESFEAGDGFQTWVRYTDDFTEHILEESRAQIEEWGFGPVTAYVHTYDRYDGYVSEVVPEYYDTVPNRRTMGLNPTFDPDPFQLGRENFEDDNMSRSDMAEFLDAIVDEPDFGILYGHSNHRSFTEDRIRAVIEMAQERDIEIVTLQRALQELNVLDMDDGENDENGIIDDGDNSDTINVTDDADDPIDTGDDTSPGVLESITDRVDSGLARLRSAGRGILSQLRDLWPF